MEDDSQWIQRGPSDCQDALRTTEDTAVCRGWDHGGTSTPIVKSAVPKPPIPGRYGSVSANAYVINAKYVQGVSLYRQEQGLSRLGVGLSRWTLTNDSIRTASVVPTRFFDSITYLLERVPNLDLGEPGVFESLVPRFEYMPSACIVLRKPA